MSVVYEWLGGDMIMGMARARLIRMLPAVMLTIADPSLADGARQAPTVTGREAELLERVAKVAETNLSAAVALLEPVRRTGSGALDYAAGNLFCQMDRYEDAVKAYRQAVDKWPEFRDARLNMGRTLLMAGNDPAAVETFQQMLRDGCADGDLWLLLGHALARLGDAVPAESAYRQALLRDVDNRDARRGLIQSLLEQRRLDEVRRLVRQALASEPGESEYWRLLANAELARDDRVAAIGVIETARRLSACPPELLLLLGDLYLDAQRPADAVACYVKARHAGAREPMRWFRAVDALIMLGEADHAETLLAETIADNGADPLGRERRERESLRLRAEIARLRGDNAKALEGYRTLADADPLNGTVMLNLGDLFRLAGDPDAAEQTYARAGRLPGFEARSLARRARLEIENRRYAEAADLLESALRLEPDPQWKRELEYLRRLTD